MALLRHSKIKHIARNALRNLRWIYRWRPIFPIAANAIGSNVDFRSEGSVIGRSSVSDEPPFNFPLKFRIARDCARRATRCENEPNITGSLLYQRNFARPSARSVHHHDNQRRDIESHCAQIHSRVTIVISPRRLYSRCFACELCHRTFNSALIDEGRKHSVCMT